MAPSATLVFPDGSRYDLHAKRTLAEVKRETDALANCRVYKKDGSVVNDDEYLLGYLAVRIASTSLLQALKSPPIFRKRL